MPDVWHAAWFIAIDCAAIRAAHHSLPTGPWRHTSGLKLPLADSLFAVIKLQTRKVNVDLLDNLNSTIVLNIFLNRLIRSYLKQLTWRVLTGGIWIALRLTVRWRGHQRGQEGLIFLMSLRWVLLLPIKLIINELKEVVLWHILILLWPVAASVSYEPLEYFLEGILAPLLVGYIIAESWMLVKLSKRVSSLFEACLEAIQVNIGAINWRVPPTLQRSWLQTWVLILWCVSALTELIGIWNSWVDILKWLCMLNLSRASHLPSEHSSVAILCRTRLSEPAGTDLILAQANILSLWCPAALQCRVLLHVDSETKVSITWVDLLMFHCWE